MYKPGLAFSSPCDADFAQSEGSRIQRIGHRTVAETDPVHTTYGDPLTLTARVRADDPTVDVIRAVREGEVHLCDGSTDGDAIRGVFLEEALGGREAGGRLANPTVPGPGRGRRHGADSTARRLRCLGCRPD